jgi:hypothetical protein
LCGSLIRKNKRQHQYYSRHKPKALHDSLPDRHMRRAADLTLTKIKARHTAVPALTELARSVWISPRTCSRSTASTRPRRLWSGSSFVPSCAFASRARMSSARCLESRLKQSLYYGKDHGS